MGKFQLNKKGEDPLKIYEDTFKIANDTVETHLDKLGKMPNPISESKASEDWEDEESERVQKALDKMNADAYMKQLTKKGYNEESLASEWSFQEDGTTQQQFDNHFDTIIEQNIVTKHQGDDTIWVCTICGTNFTSSAGDAKEMMIDHLKTHGIGEAKASEDHPVEDITDVHVHGKNNSVDKVSGVDITVEEADNYKQKDFGNQNEWEDDLDELRGLGGKLPDNNALWNSVEAIASEGKDAYGNYDAYSMPPASGYTGRDWDGRSDIEQQTDVDQKIKNVLDYEKESLASEDYGNMNMIQNPNLDTDGYPMDQEGFTRANWDDASIEDRKNWLFVAGYDSERGDEYKPYFSLDSHIRAQLAKDLQIGGIYAMGTGSL